MGQGLVSLKGGTGQWRGKSTLGVNDRGERRFLQMENCYVSSDGTEIRHFPGYATVLDLSEENNDNGYARVTHDAVLPIVDHNATSPNDVYYGHSGTDEHLVTLRARAKPVHFHCFEQIRDTVLIIGESRFREVPLMDSARSILSVTHVSAVSVAGTVRWTIKMGASVGGYTATDAAGAGFNGLSVSDVVYVEGITIASAVNQAIIAANLNGRVHEVKAIVGDTVTLHTIPSSAFAAAAVSAGTMMKVRDSRSDIYSTPNGVPAYTATLLDRPDDPDALTSWRVVDRLSFTDIFKPCYPAWVANRTRDFGDATPTSDVEGIYLRGTTRGASRREQRKLPFRVNPECATDRLILAAPQYNCLFHVPVVIPFNPDNWPSSPTNADIAGTFGWPSNNVHDQPRALGIPKARLIDSATTPAPPSPSDTASFNFGLAIVTSPSSGSLSPDIGLGLMPGEYQFAISYEDDATGEEGLASEPIFVTVPSNEHTYTLRINYIHPGWLMPECRATSINVYIAPPGTDAMAYYCSFPLSANVGSAGSFTLDAVTGYYGRAAISPDQMRALISQRDLPMKGDGTNIDEDMDPERLAPQSASMPRGGESARYVRGVLFVIGHLGETGGSLDLWESQASTLFNHSGFFEDNEMQIRAHGNEALIATPNDTWDVGGFGIGGRAFPDAYQGITLYTKELLPGPETHAQIDRVLNRLTTSLENSQYFTAHYERLRLTRPIFNRTNTAGISPVQHSIGRSGRKVWYQMPKGQLQIGDPGAPSRSSKALIQFIDPNKGDDGVAIGQLAGMVILCSRKETYVFTWARNPGAEIPTLLSNEYGCIAANSMVEFDGGLAWLSERGPVAMGSTLQFIGEDVSEDFFGSARRYFTDSRGMMRHAWGCHDAQRGLVMWGLITQQGAAGTALEIDGTDIAFQDTDDKGKSRYPCDEVLVWSYRSNAFSTWRPPIGLGIYWMRPMRMADGEVRIHFLAEDGRVYAFEDIASDSNYNVMDVYPQNAGTDSTTLVVVDAFGVAANTFGQDGDAETGRESDTQRRFVKAGMLVEFFNENDELVAETTVASAVTATGTITLAGACTWKKQGDGWKVRIGGRQRMTLITTYAGDGQENLHVDGVQMRYTLHGVGLCHGKVTLETGLRASETSNAPRTVAMTDNDRWLTLGGEHADTDGNMQRFGRRIKWNQGGAEAPEVSVKVVISGASQARIADLSLELAV